MLSRGEGPRLTPHKAALAVLGALYVHYAKSEIGAASREADRPDAAALGVWLLRKLNMQAPLLYEPTFAALQRELEEIGLRGTAAHLKRKLMDARHSPDALFDLLSDSLGAISRHHSASVPAASKLLAFVTSMRLQVAEAFSDFLPTTFTEFQAYLEEPPGETWISPASELQRFLHAQCMQLQERAQKPPFAKVKELAQTIEDSLSGLPQTHFLKYLNCALHLEFEGAVSSLHKYFDHSMEQSLRAAPDAADVELTLQNYRRRQRSVTQYAALNMALLHFTFGHDEMALRFIHESLLIAQQNADHVCIHHALVLLCRIVSARGHAAHLGQLLQRCVALQMQWSAAMAEAKRMIDAPTARQDAELSRKVHEVLSASPQSVPLLDAQNWLAIAVFMLSNAQGPSGSAQPRLFWSALTRSMAVAASFPVGDGVTASALLLRAAAWERFGCSALAALWSQAAFRAYGDMMSAPDRAGLVLALAARPGASAAAREDWLRYSARQASLGVEYGQADTSLRFKLATARGDVEAAASCAARLGSLRSAGLAGRFTSQAEALIADARVKLMRGRFVEAFQDATLLLEACESRPEPVLQVRLLLLLARVHQSAGESTNALPYVLRSLSDARRFNLHKLSLEALVALASLHLGLGAPEQGLAVLGEVLPQVYEHCDEEVQADANLCYARCLLMMGEPDALRDASTYLEHAAECRARAREANYLLARVCHELGDTQRRDAAAEAFLDAAS